MLPQGIIWFKSTFHYKKVFFHKYKLFRRACQKQGQTMVYQCHPTTNFLFIFLPPFLYMAVPMHPLWVPSGCVRWRIGTGTRPIYFVTHYEANPNSGLLLTGIVKCQQTKKVPPRGRLATQFLEACNKNLFAI